MVEKTVVTWAMVEEHRRKIKDWLKTPAGKAHLKRLRIAEAKLLFDLPSKKK